MTGGRRVQAGQVFQVEARSLVIYCQRRENGSESVPFPGVP
jgi:hypothetical protein